MGLLPRDDRESGRNARARPPPSTRRAPLAAARSARDTAVHPRRSSGFGERPSESLRTREPLVDVQCEGNMSGGATIEELKDVLRETLENRGALGSVRAHLRAEVSNALEDRSSAQRPDISNENLIINELIREYLVFNR